MVDLLVCQNAKRQYTSVKFVNLRLATPRKFQLAVFFTKCAKSSQNSSHTGCVFHCKTLDTHDPLWVGPFYEPFVS